MVSPSSTSADELVVQFHETETASNVTFSDSEQPGQRVMVQSPDADSMVPDRLISADETEPFTWNSIWFDNRLALEPITPRCSHRTLLKPRNGDWLLRLNVASFKSKSSPIEISSNAPVNEKLPSVEICPSK